jgi:pectinesterase
MIEKTVTVSPDGSGDFRTIGAAIASLGADSSERAVIRIRNGIYKEKLRIRRRNLTLSGESAEKTIITFDDHAFRTFPNGEKMNTFNSYSVYVGAENFCAENITFENSSGSGSVAGQALAMYADADRVVFRKCRFLGCQDTLLTGPLPKNPAPLGLNLLHPTLGSGDGEYREPVRHYFDECFLRGDIDFIFGSASAVFNRCEIFSNKCSRGNSYITAASTSPYYKYGYLFIGCRLTGDADPKSVYLGRPWRDHAHVAFVNCWMGEHIVPEGWHNWDKPFRETTAKYREYGSKGPGGEMNARVRWSKILSDEEAREYTVQKVLAGDDDWNPNT